MILKWQTVEGNWHLMDGVTKIINHGYLPVREIQTLSKRYDGDDAYLYWTLDASSNETEDSTAQYHYVVATIHNSREHLVIHDTALYVVSDEGKTVDKLTH